MKRIVHLWVLGVASLLAVPEARAQVDFATCQTDMPACTASLNDCCYRDFDPAGTNKPIIIPMDRCHQRVANGGKESPPSSASPKWCADPGASADDGVFQAYGLVFRLMQSGIPVYWVINPSKDPNPVQIGPNLASQVYTEKDIDFWVLSGGAAAPPDAGSALTACGGACVDPVQRLNPATLAPIADSYDFEQFPMRGGAFMIAAEDRARFNDFFLRIGEFSGNAGDAKYDFSAVDLYEVASTAQVVYQDFRTGGPSYGLFNGGNSLPVAMRIDYAPPRLALMSGGPSSVWLAKAKLDDPASTPGCRTGAFVPAEAVYCTVDEAEIAAGALVNGGFTWAWLDSWVDNSPCGSASEILAVDKVLEFMTAVPGTRAGGSVMFMEAIVEVFEGCNGREPAGLSGSGLDPINQAPTDPLILRRPQSVFMQWGDLPTDIASGSVGKWSYFNGGPLLYDPAHVGGTLARLITEDRTAAGNAQCIDNKSTPACDVFAASPDADTVDASMYLRYGDAAANGVVFYQGGNNVNGRSSHLRHILNALIAMPSGVVPQDSGSTTLIEVSRSSPVVATVGTVEAQYQGTYAIESPLPDVTTFDGMADAATFKFPYFAGHLRAFASADLGTATEFDQIPAIFDAGADGLIPNADPDGCAQNFTAACRTVFTTTEVPVAGLADRPARVFVNVGNLASLKPFLDTAGSLTDDETNVLIKRLLAGIEEGGLFVSRLGGVDRSTMAIIEQSPFIPPTTGPTARPTMIYVGATDGMLHAICAEIRGACVQAGQELWAFIPRTQLGLVRSNTTRIDGSPKVADVFDDFDGDGRREWRTILTFQTGYGNTDDIDIAPAVVGIDISNPTDPQILWERTTPSVPGVVDLGTGLNLAMGPSRVAGAVRNLTFVQTNNGGTGGAGFYLAAVDTATGAIVWTFEHEYPPPRSVLSPDVPDSGIPGGVAAFDLESSSMVTHLAVPSLYGDLWVIEADGDRPYGTDPVFRFSEDFHPIGASPTIFADLLSGRIQIAFASGGYVDPLLASWVVPATNQFAVAIAAEPAGAVPIDEVTASSDRSLLDNIGINRSFAQAVVAGNELLVATDLTDVNLATYGTTPDTGQLRRYSLTTGLAKGSIVITGGASAVDVSGGQAHVGTGRQAAKIDIGASGGAFEDQGVALERDATSSAERLLWISS